MQARRRLRPLKLERTIDWSPPRTKPIRIPLVFQSAEKSNSGKLARRTLQSHVAHGRSCVVPRTKLFGFDLMASQLTKPLRQKGVNHQVIINCTMICRGRSINFNLTTKCIASYGRPKVSLILIYVNLRIERSSGFGVRCKGVKKVWTVFDRINI